MANDRMSKKPAIVTQDREVVSLNRIPLNARMFKEEWIQHILEKNPEILPSGDVDMAYSQLLCIAREVEVPSGYIDNLYISAKGYIVIVETKLWKNPEASRTVVGQIIDYAKDVCTWDYEKLDAVYRRYHDGSSLFSAMVEKKFQLVEDEAYFIDIAEKNLKSARFLLMIVGDGIREGTEKMTAFLNEYSTLPFDLALCELEVYDMGNGSRLVVPQLTTKTKVIERTVFNAMSLQTVPVSEPPVKSPKLADKEAWAERTNLKGVDSEQILGFINDMLSLDFSYHVGTKDLCIDLPFPHLGKRIGCLMLFGVGTDGAFQPSAYYEFLKRHGYSIAPAERLFEELRPYLSMKQTNVPYERENGYYFIPMRNFVIYQNEILLAFERFKLSF